MKNLNRLLVICLIPALFIGCKVDKIDLSSSRVMPTLVALSLKPDNPSLAPNTALQLKAIGIFSNGITADHTEDVVWNSADVTIATVNSRGIAQAVSSGLASTIITAASGSITGSVMLTVSPLASLTVTPADPAMAPGTSQQLTAAGILQNSSTQDLSSFVQWTSSDTGIATISGTGIVSAGTAGTGDSIITAELSGITGTTLLTTSPIRSVTVTPADPKIFTGQTQQFTAVGSLLNGGEQNITDFAAWNLLPSTAGVISGKGLALSTAAGSALVTASLGSASGSAVLMAADPPTVVSITIAPSQQTLSPGDTRQFTARAAFSDSTFRDVTSEAVWSSSNASVAKISNNAGSKGALTALSAGTSGISASFSGILSEEAMLTVTSSTVTAGFLVITPSNPFVRAGNIVQLRASLVFPDGTLQEVSAAVWSSSNNDVAFVSQGFVTGLSAGTTTITAVNGNLSDSVMLTVTAF